MADASKFVIDDVEYPVPTRFRMIDPILVEELTGLTFADFSERLDDMNQQVTNGKQVADFAITVGLVAVAVWQEHEDWSRRKVREFMQSLDVSKLNVQTPEAPDSPPAKAPATKTPGRKAGGDTSGGSTSTQEDLSEAHV